MKDTELLQQVSKKLSVLIALELQRDGNEGIQGNVVRLARFGLTTNEIAEILGTTPGTVAVSKSRIKKTKTK